MGRFQWTDKRKAAALGLAQGGTYKQVAARVGISERSLYYWATLQEFSEEVDRLSLMAGIAGRAERLRIAHRVVRQKISEEKIETEKDLLDWLKFAQSETSGVKLDLLGLLESAQNNKAE